MEFRSLKVEIIEPGICLATVSNPAAFNALTIDLQHDLLDFAEYLNQNDEVRVGIITGDGDKSFIAGIDLGGLSEGGDQVENNYLKDACAAYEACDKPIIAMINGHCLGGGFELALACDFRIFADKGKTALTETGLGFIPGAGGMQRLVRIAGTSVAKTIVLTGTRYTGQQMVDMGLGYACVPQEQLLETTLELARTLASRAPLALKYAKYCINTALDKEQDVALAEEDEIFKLLTETEDYAEGVKAFFEKRPPVYVGR